MKIIIAFLIFGLVITFHELGHFLLAKRAGITVTEFSLGMGPRLLSFVRGGTRYSLKLLPIGGSCMMLGEDELCDDQGAFNNKNVWARISTIFAGPFFNFILAFLMALIMISIIGYDPARVTTVEENSPAAEAGLMPGDIITEFNGANIVFARDIWSKNYFDPITATEPVAIEFKRNGEKMETTITPELTKNYLLGFYYNPDSTKAEIITISEDYPLYLAGLQVGDVITEINGVKINSGMELNQYIEQNPLTNEKITLTYERNGESVTVEVTPKANESVKLGFAYNQGYEKTSVLGVFRYSFSEVRYWITSTVKSLGQLFTGKVGAEDLGGPVRIVSEIGNAVDSSKEYGFQMVIVNLLNWAILLSANLGVMNLLPIPALDGGRLIFLIIEAFRGKPINRDKEGFVHMIGFVLLMMLMVFVFFNDIRNIL